MTEKLVTPIKHPETHCMYIQEQKFEFYFIRRNVLFYFELHIVKHGAIEVLFVIKFKILIFDLHKQCFMFYRNRMANTSISNVSE